MTIQYTSRKVAASQCCRILIDLGGHQTTILIPQVKFKLDRVKKEQPGARLRLLKSGNIDKPPRVRVTVTGKGEVGEVLASPSSEASML